MFHREVKAINQKDILICSDASFKGTTGAKAWQEMISIRIHSRLEMMNFSFNLSHLSTLSSEYTEQNPALWIRRKTVYRCIIFYYLFICFFSVWIVWLCVWRCGGVVHTAQVLCKTSAAGSQLAASICWAFHATYHTPQRQAVNTTHTHTLTYSKMRHGQRLSVRCVRTEKINSVLLYALKCLMCVWVCCRDNAML